MAWLCVSTPADKLLLDQDMWRGRPRAVDGEVSRVMEVGVGVSQAVEERLRELAAPKVRIFPFLVEAHFKHKP